jgi:hypothetical protein
VPTKYPTLPASFEFFNRADNAVKAPTGRFSVFEVVPQSVGYNIDIFHQVRGIPNNRRNRWIIEQPDERSRTLHGYRVRSRSTRIASWNTLSIKTFIVPDKHEQPVCLAMMSFTILSLISTESSSRVILCGSDTFKTVGCSLLFSCSVAVRPFSSGIHEGSFVPCGDTEVSNLNSQSDCLEPKGRPIEKAIGKSEKESAKYGTLVSFVKQLLWSVSF